MHLGEANKFPNYHLKCATAGSLNHLLSLTPYKLSLKCMNMHFHVSKVYLDKFFNIEMHS